MTIWQLDARGTAELVARREVSAREVIESHLGRIDEVNPLVNAIVRRCDDDALSRADDVDNGRVTGPLAGAVVTTKINTDHVPFPSDNGIALFANNVPAETHPCVKGLIDLGLVMVGRTNSPAFAMRFHTANDLHGETLNPHDRDVSCGGSSGGAGVAVATGMCHIAQGNDVAGSIRWPAMANGVIGLRPTIGRIPTGGTSTSAPRGWGASNMATNGPLARTMRDIRAAYAAMCRGSWTDPLWVPAMHEFPSDESPRRIALVTSDGGDIEAEVVEAVRRIGRVFADAGYVVEEVTPPMTEVFFGLWERLGAQDLTLGLGPMLKNLNDSGLTGAITDWITGLPPSTPETFMSALADRDMVMRTWSRFLMEYPIVVSPLMCQPSMPRAFDVSRPGAMAELTHLGRWGVNLSAIAMPALAFPAGTANGAPLGIQLFSHAWREDLLLEAGDVLESHFGPIAPVDCAWSA